MPRVDAALLIELGSEFGEAIRALDVGFEFEDFHLFKLVFRI